MATGELQVALHLTLDEALRGYFMQRRRALLTELDDLEKLLGITPRTQELRKQRRAELHIEKKMIEVDTE